MSQFLTVARPGLQTIQHSDRSAIMRNIKTKRQSPTLSKIRPIKLPRELALAGKRIGENTTKRVKWLLSFADTDLNDLSEGQRTDLAWEIKACMLPTEI